MEVTTMSMYLPLYLEISRDTFIAFIEGSGVAGTITFGSFLLYKEGDKGLFKLERMGGFATEVEIKR